MLLSAMSIERWMLFGVMVGLLLACGGTQHVPASTNASTPHEGVGQSCVNARAPFERELHAALEPCRQCHVADGAADTPGGRAFQLSHERDDDFESIRASLARLDQMRAVGRAKFLTVPTGEGGFVHMGGTPWKNRPALRRDVAELITLLTPSARICP